MKVSEKGKELILKFEVSSESYYNKFCEHPYVPDPEHSISGVTLGIGYDLGQKSELELMGEWGEYLLVEDLNKLKQVLHLQGMKAKDSLPIIEDIIIEYEVAKEQFIKYTIPIYERRTIIAFPNIENAPQPVYDAALSLVFNRGTSFSGDSRIEMKNIRHLIIGGLWMNIPEQIRLMKRLWNPKSGLIDRREKEAKYIEDGLKEN